VWRLYDKQRLTKGIESKGVVQAMTFLTQQTKSLYGEEIPNQILATGKDVIVIGGGDTGSDCELPTDREPNQLPISRSCLHLLDEAKYTLALLAIAIKTSLHIRKVVTGIG
jgi:hypothetical protein